MISRRKAPIRRPADVETTEWVGPSILISDDSADDDNSAGNSKGRALISSDDDEEVPKAVQTRAAQNGKSREQVHAVRSLWATRSQEAESKQEPSAGDTPANHVLCALCGHVATRLYRVKSHGVAKHGITEGSPMMNEFAMKCKNLSCAGWRLTDRARIASALGQASVSDSQIGSIVRVLEAHMIRVTDAPKTAASNYARPAPSATPRKDVTKGLEKAGLAVSFSEDSLCELASLYRTLQADRANVTQAQGYANARFLHRYLKWCVKQPESCCNERKALTRPELANRFVKYLQPIMSPYSVRNHAFAVRNFIDLVLARPEEDTGFSARTRPQLREAANVWGTIKNEANRTARKLQTVKIRSGCLESFPLYAVCLFLRELRTSGTLTGFLARLSNSPRGQGVPSDLVVPYITVLCTLACSMLFQGTRLSAVLGLTCAEVLTKRKEFEGHFIVRISAHKTSRYSGPQPIVLQFIHYELFEKFCACKERLGMDTLKVFTTHRGTEPSAEYIFGPLNKFISMRSASTTAKVTFNALRKRVESSVFLLGDGTFRRAAEAGITSYLAHSRDVNHLHYRFMTDDYVLEQSTRMNEVLVQLVVLDLAADKDLELPLLPQNALEPFPSRARMNENLKDRWDFIDLPLTPVTQVTYNKICAQWRAALFDEIAKYVAQNAPDSTPSSMRRFISTLPDVWQHDSELIYGKAASSAHSTKAQI